MTGLSTIEKFMRLFRGRTDAYGTGRGEWVRSVLLPAHYASHLAGEGHGLGVGPMLDDNTVWFAAIDLDEPDFDAARDMQRLLPGTTWVERSRSGNAHVWAFFSAPVPAWIPRGIMAAATEAVGKRGVEVFPKQDRLRELPGRDKPLGNYINLPYHGAERPMLYEDDAGTQHPYGLENWLDAARQWINDPQDWRVRAEFMQLSPPETRVNETEWGEQPVLHVCAQHVLEHRFDNPVRDGARHSVMFSMAKMLRNWREVDDDEAWELLQMVNETALPPLSEGELRRQFENAHGLTSTGCDEPAFDQYAHPNCPIRNR